MDARKECGTSKTAEIPPSPRNDVLVISFENREKSGGNGARFYFIGPSKQLLRALLEA